MPLPFLMAHLIFEKSPNDSQWLSLTENRVDIKGLYLSYLSL